MNISVIIPTYNEERFITKTVKKIIERTEQPVKEIIIVDGGSTDNTIRYAKPFPLVRIITSPRKGRAVQMNYGASKAKGELLYFLHADTIPPQNFDLQIKKEVTKGSPAGCYRLGFNRKHPMLNFYAWCTRFDIDAFRFGDQSLFLTKNVFEETGGFREDHLVMEDNDMVRRIKKNYSFTILPERVTTSARKYENNGFIWLQIIFLIIYTFYQAGVSQVTLQKIYRKLIN